jgi:hypothetical protein
MMVLVHCFLRGGIIFEVDGFLVLTWWCLVRGFEKLVTVVELFFYVILF